MKTRYLSRILGGLCVGWLAMTGTALAQPTVLVVNQNGQTVVSWKGQEVFSGATEGPAAGQCIRYMNEDFAVAYAGDTLLWENVPGAAQKVKSAIAASVNLDKKSDKRGKATPGRLKRPVSTGLWVSSADGHTKVNWNGRQVFSGPTKGAVTGKARTVNGVDYAAVFEDQSALWENAKGAAKLLK